MEEEDVEPWAPDITNHCLSSVTPLVLLGVTQFGSGSIIHAH